MIPKHKKTFSGDPLLLISGDLITDGGRPIDNSHPVDWSQIRSGNYWNQFLNPLYYPDDHFLVKWLNTQLPSAEEIAACLLIHHIKKSLQIMISRSSRQKTDANIVIPQSCLPTGKSCKVALCFFSNEFVENLEQAQTKYDVQNELKLLRLCERIMVEEAEILTHTSPLDLKLRYGLRLPDTMPENLAKSIGKMSCILVTLKAETA